jgi:hypothetical protein
MQPFYDTFRQQTGRLDKETFKTSGFSLTFPFSAPTTPPIHSPTTLQRSIAKTILDQRVKPGCKNPPTLKLWREFADPEKNARIFRSSTLKVVRKSFVFKGV